MKTTYTNGLDKITLTPNNKANKGQTGFDAVLNGKKSGGTIKVLFLNC